MQSCSTILVSSHMSRRVLHLHLAEVGVAEMAPTGPLVLVCWPMVYNTPVTVLALIIRMVKNNY